MKSKQRKTHKTKGGSGIKSYKNLIKNYYIFWHLFFTDKTFQLLFLYLYDKYQKSPYRIQPLGCFLDYKNYKKIQEKAYLQRLAFLNSLDKDNKFKLFNDIDRFLITNNLGEEWFNVIADYLISSWFCPPIYNLHISNDNRRSLKNRIVLLLNPDTSIDDIKEAWWWISKKQKELYPNFKRPNFSMRSLRNLSIPVIFLADQIDKEKKNKYTNSAYLDKVKRAYGENVYIGTIKSQKLHGENPLKGIKENNRSNNMAKERLLKKFDISHDNFRKIMQRFREKTL